MLVQFVVVVFYFFFFFIRFFLATFRICAYKVILLFEVWLHEKFPIARLRNKHTNFGITNEFGIVMLSERHWFSFGSWFWFIEQATNYFDANFRHSFHSRLLSNHFPNDNQVTTFYPWVWPTIALFCYLDKRGRKFIETNKKKNKNKNITAVNGSWSNFNWISCSNRRLNWILIFFFRNFMIDLCVCVQMVMSSAFLRWRLKNEKEEEGKNDDKPQGEVKKVAICVVVTSIDKFIIISIHYLMNEIKKKISENRNRPQVLIELFNYRLYSQHEPLADLQRNTIRRLTGLTRWLVDNFFLFVILSFLKWNDASI